MDEEPPLGEYSHLRHWNASPEQLSDELSAFLIEFGSFTPEVFAELKFHLLKGHGLTKAARRELCGVSASQGHCPKCDLLYVAKKCPLWYRLYRVIRWSRIERTPPCIRLAYVRRNIRTVADYLTLAGLITLPFYTVNHALSCKVMHDSGLCQPNHYCREKHTDNVLEYTSARERVKLSRPLS